MKIRLQILLLIAAIVAIGLLCIFMIPYGDELAYAYAGQNSYFMPWPPARIQSFHDILIQQWRDYNCHGNGRVLLQIVNAVFSWQRLYLTFRILNVGVWFLLVWLALRSSHLQKISVAEYLCGFAFVFWFFWYSDITSCNACFALSYLWGAALTLVMAHLWRKPARWWLLPLSTFYGFTHESYVLPFLGALLGTAVYGIVLKTKREVSWLKVAAWCLMLAGAVFVCFGPAARLRAQNCGGGLGGGTLSGIVHLILLGTPCLLFVLVSFVLVCARKRIRETMERDLFWWFYFAGGCAIWMMVCSDVFLRTACAWFLAGMVLCISNCQLFSPCRKFYPFLCGVSFLWLFGAAAMQTVVGIRSLRMLDLYRSDPQGVTCYDEIAKGPLFYTCNDSASGWGCYYQLEFGHQNQMAVFPSWLYHSLYENESAFWREARLVDGNVFCHDRIPKVLFVRAERVSDSDRKCAKAYFTQLQSVRRSDWRDKLPGRVSIMFPKSDEHLVLPNGAEYSFRTQSGTAVTILLDK